MRNGGVCEMHIVKKLLLVFFIIVLAIAAVLLSTCSYDCPTCKDHKTIDCTDCDSKGTVACTNCDGSGTLPCFWCNGKGTKKLWCNLCNGLGYTYEVDAGFSNQIHINKRDCLFCEDGYKSESCPPYVSCGCQGGKVNCASCVGIGKVKCPDC